MRMLLVIVLLVSCLIAGFQGYLVVEKALEARAKAMAEAMK